MLRVADIAAVARPGTRPVEAQWGNGVVWRRHWSETDRLVVDFVGLAMVEVDDRRGTVVFDRMLAAEREQHLLLDHVVPLVLARKGALVLHGAVVSLDGRGVVLVGSSGAGKSTLAAFLWQRGWVVGGDDGAVLCIGDPPTVEPTYTTMRLTPASVELVGLSGETTTPVVDKLRIQGDGRRSFRQEPVGLSVIAVIEPAAVDGAARFEPLGGTDAHAELFGSTFHADLSRDHLPGVLDGLASTVEATTVGRLFVPRGRAGLASTDRLLRSLLSAGGGRTDPAPPGVEVPGTRGGR